MQAVELNLGTFRYSVMEIHHPEVKPLNSSPESSLISFRKKLGPGGEIHLKYQQLYDKQDAIYTLMRSPVASFLKIPGKIYPSLRELAEDLNYRLNWIAGSWLNHVNNYMNFYYADILKPKLIVNLNKRSVFRDRTFPEFISS